MFIDNQAKRLARMLYEAHQEAASALGYGVMNVPYDELDQTSRELHELTAMNLLDKGLNI